MSRFRQREGLQPVAKPTRADYGRMLDVYDWDFVVHLTTEEPVSEASLQQRFIVRFIRGLVQSVQHPVPYFYAIERHASGLPHLHGLIGGTRRLTVEQVPA